MKAKYLDRSPGRSYSGCGLALAQQPRPPRLHHPDEPFEHNFSFFMTVAVFWVFTRKTSTAKTWPLSPEPGARRRRDPGRQRQSSRKSRLAQRRRHPAHRRRERNQRSQTQSARFRDGSRPFSKNHCQPRRFEQEVTATIGKRNNSSFAKDLLPRRPRVWKWEGTDPKTWKWEGPHTRRICWITAGDLHSCSGNSRRIGVSTMELTKQLADYFGIADGKACW